jgi:DNA-binding transcriptional regulator YhcF (GntR family)
MKPAKIFEYIHIDEYSSTPKYLQISNSIMNAIAGGMIKIDQLLPSINELSYVLEISRDTAEKGYKHLKKIGILGSVPSKGYYIINTDFGQTLKIFLLFNKLSAHKKIIYDAFVKALGDHVTVDFYIYNNDFGLFKKMLSNKKGDYSHYVIIPHFLEGGEYAHEVINTIPKEKLLLLDKQIAGVDGEYAAVFQNFEKDIYGALEQARQQLSKYNTLKIVFPKRSYYAVEIIKGFNNFCHQYAFTCKVVDNINDEIIEKGEAYILVNEDDLVTFIERIISQKLKIGKEVGVISYNETPLRRIILKGITTVSTDFALMGSLAAELIKTNSRKQIEVPFYLTVRSSI